MHIIISYFPYYFNEQKLYSQLLSLFRDNRLYFILFFKLKVYKKIKQKLAAVENRLMLKTGLYAISAQIFSFIFLVFSIKACLDRIMDRAGFNIVIWFFQFFYRHHQKYHISD